MTETELEPLPTVTSSKANAGTWDTAFAALKARYPKAKDSIVFCIHELQNNPEVALDDLKARAAMHGIRVTGASVNAAQRMMAPQAASDAPDAETAPVAAKPKVRRGRPARAAAGEMDAEAMLRQVVAKMQAQGGKEAERLRAAIRGAVAVLQAAVG
jgi:hypothetical protein